MCYKTFLYVNICSFSTKFVYTLLYCLIMLTTLCQKGQNRMAFKQREFGDVTRNTYVQCM